MPKMKPGETEFTLRGLSGTSWKSAIDTEAAQREVSTLVQAYGYSETLARLLVTRQIPVTRIEHFLQPTLRHHLSDPAHLLDMDKAVARLHQAIEGHQRITIFGDYDVDGATSTALLLRYFASLGMEADYYIPDRMKEGYGPNIAAFEKIIAKGCDVIITVDCGTLAYEPIAAAQQAGVDVIVIDHHQALPKLPDACAIVNPNRLDQTSDCTHLAAVGVCYLLLIALNRYLRDAHFFASKNEPDLLGLLDLVALGTVCDVVPLHGLNRAFVAQGLKVIHRRTNTGITALSDIARLDEPATAYHAGFLIGPRINAGGRVGQSSLGAEILSSDDRSHCDLLAEQLNRYNQERQAIEAQVLEEALAQAEAQVNQPCIMVAADHWHEGVIGIVAGRLKERYQRPAMVVCWQGDSGKGSGRSISGADLGAAISAAQLQGLLLKGGGHAMAAGWSLERQQWPVFCDFMMQRFEQAVSDYQQGRVLRYDMALPVPAMHLGLCAELDRLAPFGMGNPSPRLVVQSALIIQHQRMKEKHLRLILSDTATRQGRLVSVSFQSVGEPLGDFLEERAALGQPVHLYGQLKRNRWNAQESAQFLIEDAAAAG